MRCKPRAAAREPTAERRAPSTTAPAAQAKTANNVQRELRALPGNKRKKKTKHTPALRPLKFGTPYCELCKQDIHPGEPTAFWPAARADGRVLPTAYCADCHHANVRNGRPLQ